MATRIARIWSSPNRWVLLLGVAVLVLAVGGLFAVIRNFRQASTPAQPSDFYTPPAILPEGEPGTIIRSEPLPDSLPEGAQAYRVM